MALRDLIEQIAADWPTYHQKETVESDDPVFEMITVQFPHALQPYVAAEDTIVVEGSSGRGNITAAPWIALFDRRLTTSATTGYYVVYLFSTDMSAVTLTLAFGTTQFEAQFGGPAKAFPRMRAAASRLQEMFNHLIPADLARGPIDLAASRRQKLHYAYQQATILSCPPYRIGALPDEARFVSDLQTLVRLYVQIVSDPLEPTVERLVESVVEPAARVEEIEVREFEPRPMRKGRDSSGSGNKRKGRRYSPESRKVGDAGEKAVVLYERKRLMELGRQDLADRVRWHGPEREFVGWDITSFDDDGSQFFIEVKSSAGKAISCVDLTVNEWEAACHAEKRERYYIYLVTDALSAVPCIERLRNPAAYVDSGQLPCEPIIFELQLHQP